MRIPIQLDALCFAWTEEIIDIRLELYTMTDVYRAIEQSLWIKDIRRLEKKDNGEPVTQDHISEDDAAGIEDLIL